MTASANQRPDHGRFPIPISRFHTQSQSQSQPLPPPGTDVPSHEDADALDAWLDAWAQARDEEVAAPSASHDARSNGQVASARHFHARFAAAEEAEAPETPVDAIWEQIMANTLVSPIPPSSPVPITAARSVERRPNRHPMLIAVGSHPAATAILVAGVILAIVLVFRAFAHDPNAPIIDYGPAANTGIASATATASPPAAACTVTVMTDAEAQALVQNNSRPRVASDFLPLAGPVNAADAQGALETYRGAYQCDWPTGVHNDLMRLNLQSDAFVSRGILASTPQGRVQYAEESLALSKALSPSFATEDRSTYIVSQDDPSIAPYLAAHAKGAPPMWALLPQDFVTLADGRIGVPQTQLTMGPVHDYVTDFSPQTVQFLVFRSVNGQWLIDDNVTLCVANCDAYYAEQEQQLAKERSALASGTAIASPKVSPVASLASAPCTVTIMTDDEAQELVKNNSRPRAASDYLPVRGQPVVSNTNAQEALETYRGAVNCDSSQDVRNVPFQPRRWSLLTDKANADYIDLATPESYPERIEENIALTKALSPILATPDASAYVVDPTDPRVAPYIITNTLNANVPAGYLLPQDFVTLPDGRIGAPLKHAPTPPANNREVKEWVTDYSLPTSQSPETVPFIIFKQVDGQWLVDDGVTLCIANCDTYYAEAERQIAELRSQYGSALDSPTSEASPAAIDRWLQPVTSADCTNPGTGNDRYEEAALIGRQIWACGALNPPLQVYSDDLLARHPEVRNGQYTQTAEDVAEAKAIAPIVAKANLTLEVTGIPTDNGFALNVGFYLIFLPQNAIVLDDGRFAIPYTEAYPDRPNATATPTGSSSFTGVPLYVFRMNGDTVQFDGFLMTCFGECSEIWAQSERQIGTPVPSADMIATMRAQRATPAASDSTPTQISGGDNSRPTQTPKASPETIQLSTPDENGCIIRTLSAADQTAIANPAAMPTPDYTVAGPLNSEAIARDAIDMLSSSKACSVSHPSLPENQHPGALSNEMLAESYLSEMPDTRIPLYEQRLARDKHLSAQLVVQDPTLYTVDSNDPSVKPWLMSHYYAESIDGVLLPEDFMTFADGRVGGPIKLALPGGFDTISKESILHPNTVIYVFFRQVDGVWLIDETATLCTWKCDEWFAARQRDIDADRATHGLATPESSPSSAATPEAAFVDPWLQPISLAECQHPFTDASLNEQAAILLRQSTACFDQGDTTTVPVDQFYSAEFLRRHPELRSGQYTLAEADVANAEAMAPTVAQRDLQLYVTGLPGADDDSSRTDGFYEVYLPQRNMIDLGPARFAIPLTIAFPDEAKTQQAATAIATSKDPVTVVLYVFTLQGGKTPQVDDILLTCIANCDTFWEQQRAKIGTPEPSNEQVATQAATATAVAAAKQPIPASECAVPTVTGEEQLAERAYTPLLKPTDANATAVSQNARAFIACIEASPTTGAHTPPARVQDVVAPFETQRRRDEMAKADPSVPVQPTDAQIAAGKDVSAYLEAQGVTTFTERAPKGVVDPGDSSWPATALRNGQPADTSPGWYTVPMPGIAVQLSDGRIGIPMMMMVTNDDLWAYIQTQPSSGSLGVFAKVGDQWLLDDVLALCVGDCDAYWTQVATPLPSSEWLQPVQASECVPVSASTYRDDVRPRDYMIANTAGQPDVARQSRALAACAPDGGLGMPSIVRSQFETARERDASNAGAHLTTEQIAAAKGLSTAYEERDYRVYRRAPAGVNVPALGFTLGFVVAEGRITYTIVYLPDEAVTLTDGRVAIPSTWLISDEASWNVAMQQPFQETQFTIWANIDGTWLIDETLPLCIGDCTAYWDQIATYAQGTPAAASSSSSPQTTPDASPAADIWHQPIAASECVPVSAAANHDDVLPRVYSIANNPAIDGQGASQQSRARTACMGVTPQAAASDFETTRHATEDIRRLSTTQIAGAKELSTNYTKAGFSPYQRAPQGVDFRDANTTTAQRADEGPIVYTPIFDPATAVELGDGRVAIPTTYLIADDRSWNQAQGQPLPITTALTIWAHVDGTWLIDEELPLCIGDCNALWTYLESRAPDAPPTTPGAPASPEASAALPADYWLRIR